MSRFLTFDSPLMPTPSAPAVRSRWLFFRRELQAGLAGTLISLAPVLTLGLLAFAAFGPQAAALGIPAPLG